MLDEIALAAEAVAESDPPVGGLLVSSVQEVGARKCVVVAASRPAQAALAEWLAPSGVFVLTAGGLRLSDVFGHNARNNVAEVLAAPPSREPSNWSQRYKANLEKLASGDANKVAEVVRDLRHRNKERGLSAGERVVTTNQYRLQPGTGVQVVEPTSAKFAEANKPTS